MNTAILPWEVFVVSAFILGVLTLGSLILWVFRPRPKRAPIKRIFFFLACGALIFYAFKTQPNFEERFRRGIAMGKNYANTSDTPELAELTTPRYTMPPRDLGNVALPVIEKQSGWKVTLKEQDNTSFRVDIPVLFGLFHDEMTIALVAEGAETTRVDIQSRSLKGSADLGANRRHVLQFIYALNQELGITDSQGLEP